jgi:HSP20 family protein
MATLMVRDPFFAAPFRLLDEMFRASGNGGDVTGFTPLLDVRETEDEYLVMVDLPGVRSEDVNIELNEQVLTISGSRVPVETGASQLAERPFGSFARSLTLPAGVNSDEIKADYHNGVLELHITKPADIKPRKIEIRTGSQKQIEQ